MTSTNYKFPRWGPWVFVSCEVKPTCVTHFFNLIYLYLSHKTDSEISNNQQSHIGFKLALEMTVPSIVGENNGWHGDGNLWLVN